MLQLPDFILDEIFSYVDESKQVKFRLVSKKWDFLLQSNLLKRLWIGYLNDDWANKKTFLKKFGKNVTNLDVYPGNPEPKTLEDWKVHLLRNLCPNIKSITYSFYGESQLYTKYILEFGMMFPKLKKLVLFLEITLKDLEILTPLISKLDFLELEFSSHEHENLFDPNEFVKQLKSLHLKRLVFPDHLGYDFMDLAVRELVSISVIESHRGDSLAYGPSYVYDRKKNMFEKILIGDCEDDLQATFTFDLEKIHAKDGWFKGQTPSEVFRFFKSIFYSGDHYSKIESELPPIKAMTYHNREMSDTNLKAFLTSLTIVQDISFYFYNTVSKDSLPELQFSAIKFRFDTSKGYFFSWVSRCFPELKIIDLNAIFNEDEVEKLGSISFKKLTHFKCFHMQPMSFWRMVIPTCPSLRTVTVYVPDESFSVFQEEFKNIYIESVLNS